MKKRIGIITHYYHTLNYGGVLQAYALCKFLNKNGYCAEQICFDYSNGLSAVELKGKPFHKILILISINVYYIVLNWIKNIRNWSVRYKRKKSFYSFENEMIPHSSRVYKWNQIDKCVVNYDCFICGSDLVWSAPLLRSWDPFFLGCVKGKKKISYAASLGKNQLTYDEIESFRKKLHDFSSVSVREKKSIDLLYGVSPVAPKLVVDPVFLLDRNDWQDVCEIKPCNNPYVLCFFIGSGDSKRSIVSEYCQKENLRLVMIPHLDGFCASDIGFGDEQICAPTPLQFVELIANADIIFTDSFHVIAFSIIFRKEFFVFPRDEKNAGINERLNNITDLIGATDHYCISTLQLNYNYIRHVERIDYHNTTMLDIMIRDSKEYIEASLL